MTESNQDTLKRYYDLVDGCAEMAQHLSTGADDPEIIEALKKTSLELEEIEPQVEAMELAEHERFWNQCGNIQ